MSDTAWQEMETSGEKTPAWDYKQEKEFIGIYEGFRENVGPNKSRIYSFTTKKGKMSVWGTALLDSKLPEIPVGEEVKLTYEGKLKNPATNRNYHSFKIFHRAVKK